MSWLRRGANRSPTGVQLEESVTALWGTVSPKGLSCFHGTLPERLEHEMVSTTSICPISAVQIYLIVRSCRVMRNALLLAHDSIIPTQGTQEVL